MLYVLSPSDLTNWCRITGLKLPHSPININFQMAQKGLKWEVGGHLTKNKQTKKSHYEKGAKHDGTLHICLHLFYSIQFRQHYITGNNTKLGTNFIIISRLLVFMEIWHHVCNKCTFATS